MITDLVAGRLSVTLTNSALRALFGFFLTAKQRDSVSPKFKFYVTFSVLNLNAKSTVESYAKLNNAPRINE